MAKKMDAEMAKRLKALNINAKTEDAAREKLLGILEENGIEGMEDEDTDTLIDIAESFVEPESEPESDDDDDDEEEEEPAPKKKVAAKPAKPAKKGKK